MGAQPQGGRRPFLARRLADSQELRHRVEAAERLGISPRRLDGWEPTERTQHFYDKRGRLVRSVTTRDPEWSEEDVAWLLALAAYRETRCPACGGDIAECTAPEADGAFEVPPPTRCHAKTALEIAQKTYAETPQPSALLWRVKHRR